MARSILGFILLFVVLVAAQVIIFNHLFLFNVALPLVFIYFIIKLPVTLGLNWTITLSFLLGLTIDIFSDTQGMNALACTIFATLKKPVLRLYFPREEDLTDPEPSIKSLGLAVFMKYLISMTVIYCVLYFTIESFSFFNPIRLLLRVIGSSVLTFSLILGIDCLSIRRNAKRL